MGSQPAVLQVVILRDGLLIGTEVLVPGSYTVGSEPGSALHLDDEHVEGTHAVLLFKNGRIAVQDNSAEGGVFVNGHRISACEVRSVDEVGVGPFTLKLKLLSQKPARAAVNPELASLLETPVLKSRPTKPAPAPGVQAPMKRPPAPPAIQVSAPPTPAGTVPSARRLAAAIAAEPSNPRALKPPTPPIDDKTQPTVRPRLRAVTPIETPVADDPSLVSFDTQELANALQSLDVPGPLDPVDSPRAQTSRGQPQETGSHRSPFPEAKGAPRLFFELYWGEDRRDARSFGAIKDSKPVVGACDEKVALPLWGFTLPADEPFVAAIRPKRGTYRVFVPPRAVVELRAADGTFHPVTLEKLPIEETRRYVELTDGKAARLSEGEMSLVAYVQPPLKRPFPNPFKGQPYLMLGLLGASLAGFVAFTNAVPKRIEAADFEKKNLPAVAVRLIAPEPKKKEAAKKKLEALKEKAVKKEPLASKKKLEKPLAAAPAPTRSAFKALRKLTAAGPATSDILAAVDKMGNGPGSKSAKNTELKLSGLLGKTPVANAGIGTFGLGGGGKGGFGTKGSEILRGSGAGGIGALGIGSVGRGKVGGTVGTATARQVAVRGSIDREAVAKVVNSHLQEVRACYERALLKDPGLAGKVVLEWTISTVGDVVTAKTKSSTLRNAAVEGCILQQLKGWTFPKARGGVVIVSYPFLFNSVGY